MSNIQEINSKFEEGLKKAEVETGETFEYEFVSFERKTSDDTYSNMCEKVGTTLCGVIKT